MSLVTVQRSSEDQQEDSHHYHVNINNSKSSNLKTIASSPSLSATKNSTLEQSTTFTTTKFRSSNNYVKLNKIIASLLNSNKLNNSNSKNNSNSNQFHSQTDNDIISSSNFNQLKAIYSSNSLNTNNSIQNRQSNFRKSVPPKNESSNAIAIANNSNQSNNNNSLNSNSNNTNNKRSATSDLIKRFSLNLLDSTNNSNNDKKQVSTNSESTKYFTLNLKSLKIQKLNNNNNNNNNIVHNMNNNSSNNSNFNGEINNNCNLIEKYFVVKDAALILPKRSSSTHSNRLLMNAINHHQQEQENQIKCNNSILVSQELTEQFEIPSLETATEDSCKRKNEEDEENDKTKNSSITKNNNSTGDILIHLQAMISILRPTDTIILAVKLCSYQQDRIRYLVIVETTNNLTNKLNESAILGLDIHNYNNNGNEQITKKCTVGLILPIYANCELSLDGDGGFKFKSHQSTHIFKPVSIQAMWSAYQYLHKTFELARKNNFYSIQLESQSESDVQNVNLEEHEWFKYYSSLIPNKFNCSNCVSNSSNKTDLNEWYQKEERTAQREDFTTPYFDCLQLCKEQEEIGLKIKEKLREIMISSKDDYGSMSSVHIREILENELQLKLDSFKKFIDATIFQFYNQLVECATQIMPYLFLGTEWNASNYDSLIQNRITHILNVSSEVDNFFPDTFKYLNIRVLDIEKTDLLKEFDRTNKFIQEAKEQGTGCLVHCKMGVSRSASVVIAYLMKEMMWSYSEAFNFAKQKRNCINPNESFREQLITYESILNAHRAKYNLFENSNQQQQQVIFL